MPYALGRRKRLVFSTSVVHTSLCSERHTVTWLCGELQVQGHGRLTSYTARNKTTQHCRGWASGWRGDRLMGVRVAGCGGSASSLPRPL